MTKHILSLLIISLFSSLTFGQVTGDWYGRINRGNRSTDVTLHLSQVQNTYSATIDFPTDKKRDIKASIVEIDGNEILLIFPDQQFAIEGSWNAQLQEIASSAVYAGKPFPFTLRRKAEAPISATQNEPRVNDGEGGLSPDPEQPRTIDAGKSLFIEELTWVDVRDALKAGKKTIIIGTGGTEPSGPYIVTGKHNYILHQFTEALAAKLGDALIAPIVPFVPEGNLDTQSGHVKYPGTISVREETYEALLDDIATSFLIQGFTDVILIGDSGGNQWGMYVVSKKLSRRWKSQGREILFIPEYYDNIRLTKWLRENGVVEVSEGIHDNFKVSAQLAVGNTAWIRSAERNKAGKFSINGIQLEPIDKTLEWGKKIIDYQVDVTIQAIRKKQAKK